MERRMNTDQCFPEYKTYNKIKFSFYRKSVILAINGWYSGFFDRSTEKMKQSKGIFYVLMAALFFSIGGLCIKVVPWSPLAINGARNLISVMIIGI